MALGMAKRRSDACLSDGITVRVMDSNRFLTILVESVGLAADEEREQQDGLFQRFSRTVLGESGSDSPRASASDDSDRGPPIPDPDGNDVVQPVTGNGFQIAVEDAEPTWTVPSFPISAHIVRRPEQYVYPDWMTEARKHMLSIEGLQPVPWDSFDRVVHQKGKTRFAVIEQRRFDECSGSPALTKM
jgi:hypothetical protein